MQARQKIDKRSKLVNTATKLAYERGFYKTTLADIAQESKVPLGNVYYYFKTKDEIGAAIVEQRIAESIVLHGEWNRAASPKERLEAFIQMTHDNRELVARRGCPIGSLCAELHKVGGTLAKKARPLFDGQLAWIEEQFRTLGKGEESQGLALHLLSALQGVSLLAHSAKKPEFMVTEANHLKEWIRRL